MTYKEWTTRYGALLLQGEVVRAVLLAQVPDAYGRRYRAASRRRNAMARAMGGTSRFDLGVSNAR